MADKRDGVINVEKKKVSLLLQHPVFEKDRGAMFLRTADASAEFSDPKSGLKGEVFWPVGGSEIVVQFSGMDIGKGTYRMDLIQLVQAAVQWETKKTERRKQRAMYTGEAPPKVGDKIYVPTKLYIDRGEDDVLGGVATVEKIEKEYGNTFVHVKEQPGHGYNWEYLREQQANLKREFGRKKASPDPDF